MELQKRFETQGHRVGKKIVKYLLKSENFTSLEIKDEYPIIYPTGKIRIIDIVAISKPLGKKYAYEVGDLNGGSKEELYCIFDKVEKVDKIDLEGEKIEIVLNYFREELDFWKNHNREIPTIPDYSIFLKDDFVEIDKEKLEEHILEEIDFLYKNLEIAEENYDKIKKRITNWYLKRIKLVSTNS